jgi:hypothetical protein
LENRLGEIAYGSRSGVAERSARDGKVACDEGVDGLCDIESAAAAVCCAGYAFAFEVLAIPDGIVTAVVDSLLARRGLTIELLYTIVPELSVHGARWAEASDVWKWGERGVECAQNVECCKPWIYALDSGILEICSQMIRLVW